MLHFVHIKQSKSANQKACNQNGHGQKADSVFFILITSLHAYLYYYTMALPGAIILVGDYYIPDLKLPEERRPIGKYGRMHREYLREVHPARLSTLTLSRELWTYLADLNEQAQERLDIIMEQMKTAEGVTEELKRTHQMEWVQRCNNIHNRAEEIVLHEMIYS